MTGRGSRPGVSRWQHQLWFNHSAVAQDGGGASTGGVTWLSSLSARTGERRQEHVAGPPSTVQGSSARRAASRGASGHFSRWPINNFPPPWAWWLDCEPGAGPCGHFLPFSETPRISLNLGPAEEERNRAARSRVSGDGAGRPAPAGLGRAYPEHRGWPLTRCVTLDKA